MRSPAPVTSAVTAHVGRGIMLMVLAVFCFALMDAVAKLLSTKIDMPTIIWARYAGQFSLTLAALATLFGPRMILALKTTTPWIHALRSGLLLGATTSFYFALSGLPIAEATAIFEIAPLVITGLAVFFLGEHVGLRRWLAVGAGLLGALIIIRPGSEVFTIYAILPLIAASCYAGYTIATRFLGSDESAWTSLFYGGILGTIVTSILVMPGWQMPWDPVTLILLLLIGPIGGGGQLFLILALRHAPASLLAPFGYCGLAFATIWGVLIFNEWPDGPTVLGAAIIVGAGLFVWARERKRSPEAGHEA